jgi:hypothetical protein
MFDLKNSNNFILKCSDFAAMKKFFSANVIFIALFILTTPKAFSQETEALMLEPTFTVNFSTETKWSYSLGLANRGILIDEIDADNFSEDVTEHLEVNSWVKYSTGEDSNVSIGIRYRFREPFDSEQENFARILQQYYNENRNVWIGWWHRVRFEQRFSPSITIFRLRYQLGLSRAISKTFDLKLSTEALYSISSSFKPQPGQRIAFQLAANSIGSWDFYLGPQYRMDNYVRNQRNTFYILTGATLNL